VRRDGRRETSGANSVTNHPYPIVSASHEHSNFIDEICNQSVCGFRERDDECSKDGIRDLLQLFPMEDAMVGNWLLGVDKVANHHRG